MATVPNLDARLENADWQRQDPAGLGMRTTEELREYIEDIGWTVEQFKRLPLYKRNKDHPLFEDL